MTSIYIFVLSLVYLVEYTLHQNLMIEIYTRNFDLHITVPSPNLAFFAETWTISPIQSINQSIFNVSLFALNHSEMSSSSLGFKLAFYRLTKGINFD